MLRNAKNDCSFANTSISHRRGRYYSKTFGISFGGGQVYPTKMLARRVDCRSPLSVEKLTYSFSTDLLKCYYPRIHSLYTNVLTDLCKADPMLDPNFTGCCFAASTLNFERAVSVPHRDSKNLICGECGIHSEGTFDYTKGGHLILWDLKLIVEFPPGCTALIPSALLRHSNTTIGRTQSSRPLVYFVGDTLISCRTKTFLQLPPESSSPSGNEHRDNLWKTGLDLLQGL
ncbi:hypothetical protein FB446DRAFT_644394 [Lentinula raphanica]|nr:hypothetical protein FB446DRAFT_644394 [Lentinula raphanica]